MSEGETFLNTEHFATDSYWKLLGLLVTSVLVVLHTSLQYLAMEMENVTAFSDRKTGHQLNNIFWCASGDKSGGWGLSSSPTHGMPCHALPADARLLAEGPKQPAEIWADCQHPGQTHPQSQQSQNHSQHRVQVCHSGGLALARALDYCSDPKLPSAVPLLNVTFWSSSHAP